MAQVEQIRLRPDSQLGSGGVIQYLIPDQPIKITRISTFCPDVIGPGPVHVYLIESDALVMLDAGMPTHPARTFFYTWRRQPIPPELAELPPDQSERELVSGLERAGYAIEDVDLLVMSHGHPDHYLNGRTIAEIGNFKTAVHVLDTPDMCNPWGLLNMWVNGRKRMTATGMPESLPFTERELRMLGGDRGFDSFRFGLSVDIPLLGEGALSLNGAPIRGIETLNLPGHSPGSVGLLVGAEGRERILLAGDVLLSPTTPHPNDLLAYLRTMKRLGALEDTSLVLAAHGLPMWDLRSRVEELSAHHKKRLERTHRICDTPACVWDVATAPKYFDTYVDPEKFNYLAGNEALVHLELLNMVGALEKTHVEGHVQYFRNRGEDFDDVYDRISDMIESEQIGALMRS